jgi:hypothetical protein
MNTRQDIARLLTIVDVPEHMGRGWYDEFCEIRDRIEKEFRLEWDGDVCIPIKSAKVIEALGMKATDVFKKFIKDYNNNYRVDLAVTEFYKLSDDDIVEMMDELPYFNKSYSGHDKFKPTAANFLKGKIWKEDYPRKINRDRTRKKTIHEITTWEEYKAILPKENRDTIESYISLGIKFEDFKSMIQNEIKKS